MSSLSKMTRPDPRGLQRAARQEDWAITNTQRIVGAMPTIEMALAKGAKSVVLSALRSVRTTSPGSFPIPPL